jgi:hypothetical protein
MRSRGNLALCLAALASSATFAAAAQMEATREERWVTLDSVRGVGRIDWTCKAGEARTRYLNRRTSARVRAFAGSAELRLDVVLHPGVAVEMPFGQRVQRWRVQPLSESLPEPVNFRIRPVGPPCARPVVLHDLG